MKENQSICIIQLEGPICIFENERIQWTHRVYTSLHTMMKSFSQEYVLWCEEDWKEGKNQVLQEILASLSKEDILFDHIVFGLSELLSLIEKTPIDRYRSCCIGSYPIEQLRSVTFSSWPTLLASDVFHRKSVVTRKTLETSIKLDLDLDGNGSGCIKTGIPFFDHMLHQIVKHGRLNLTLDAQGDTDIDDHHTIEDVAIVFGKAVLEALHDKRGIQRYGCCILPMDDTLAQVAIDLSNRPWCVWNVTFSRSVIGSFSTEMLYHFFKTFSDEARCNINISVSAGNAHHQAEAICKAFGRALGEAISRRIGDYELPSTKGAL